VQDYHKENQKTKDPYQVTMGKNPIQEQSELTNSDSSPSLGVINPPCSRHANKKKMRGAQGSNAWGVVREGTQMRSPQRKLGGLVGNAGRERKGNQSNAWGKMTPRRLDELEGGENRIQREPMKRKQA